MCVLFAFISLIHFDLVYVGHFLNTIVFFGPFCRPLWLSAVDSRLARLMVAPALAVFVPVLSPQREIKLAQKSVCFTNPCINLLVRPFVTREYHPKV